MGRQNASTTGAIPTGPASEKRPLACAVAFDKGGCQAQLRKHPALKGRIEQAVSGQLAHGMFKSKFATRARWRGLPIWECRVNERSVGAVRAAFAVEGRQATVLYISTTLQKRAFTAELERFLARQGGDAGMAAPEAAIGAHREGGAP